MVIDGVSQVNGTELFHGHSAGGADKGASGPLWAISKWTVCLGLASPICILSSICPLCSQSGPTGLTPQNNL